jgi:acetyl esterase/lipase
MPNLRHSAYLVILVFSIQFLCPVADCAQLSEGAKAAIRINDRYTVFPDLTYGRAGNYELKLDLYQPRNSGRPTPVIMYVHGGGWATGSKAEEMFWLLPYLQAGWAGVNVEYRTSPIAPAPAAVEDCRCALRWIRRNARQYNLDLGKITVTGASAGGHLALMTALVPDTAGFDNQCLADDDQPWTGKIPEAPRVAAVINWFGPTDLVDMARKRRSYAVSWLNGPLGMEELAKRVSPITYIRPGVPPVLTIHGDSDPLVPYSQAVQLHDALKKAGVRNQLITVAGGKHGEFPEVELLKAYQAIQVFLQQLDLVPDTSK